MDAGRERVRCTGENDRARVEVVVEVARDLRQLEDGRLIECVQTAVTVEAHDGNWPLAFDADVLLGHCAGLVL